MRNTRSPSSARVWPEASRTSEGAAAGPAEGRRERAAGTLFFFGLGLATEPPEPLGLVRSDVERAVEPRDGERHVHALADPAQPELAARLSHLPRGRGDDA